MNLINFGTFLKISYLSKVPDACKPKRWKNIYKPRKEAQLTPKLLKKVSQ